MSQQKAVADKKMADEKKANATDEKQTRTNLKVLNRMIK